MTTQSVQRALLAIATTWGKGSEQREIIALCQDSERVTELASLYPASSSPTEVAYRLVTDLFCEPLDELFDRR